MPRRRPDEEFQNGVRDLRSIANEGLRTSLFSNPQLVTPAGRTQSGIPLQSPPLPRDNFVGFRTRGRVQPSGRAFQDAQQRASQRLGGMSEESPTAFVPARPGSAFGRRQLSKRSDRERIEDPLKRAQFDQIQVRTAALQDQMSRAQTREERDAIAAHLSTLNSVSLLRSREITAGRAGRQEVRQERDARSADLHRRITRAETQRHHLETEAIAKRNAARAEQRASSTARSAQGKARQKLLDKGAKAARSQMQAAVRGGLIRDFQKTRDEASKLTGLEFTAAELRLPNQSEQNAIVTANVEAIGISFDLFGEIEAEETLSTFHDMQEMLDQLKPGQTTEEAFTKKQQEALLALEDLGFVFRR